MTTINPRNPQCLHCWLSAATEAWAVENARRNAAGKIIIDVDEVLTKVGELVAEHIAGLAERPKRRAALKYAHTCVDAAYRYAVTGKQQEVVTPEVETEH